MKRSEIIILMVLILALGACLRVTCFAGYASSDDHIYVALAQEAAAGDAVAEEPSIWSLRAGIIAPMALCFKAFGFSEFSMLIYPFVISMLGIILAFFAASVFFGHKAGLAAAFIQAILPMDIRYATQALPDLAAAFWAAAGVFLLYWAKKRKSFPARVLLGSLAGFFLGFAWLTKETVIYLLPFLAVYLVWTVARRRRSVDAIIAAALMLFLVLSAESLAHQKGAGDPFYRFHMIGKNYELHDQVAFIKGGRHGWHEGSFAKDLLTRLFKTGPEKIFRNYKFGLLPLVALAGILYAVCARRRRFLFAGVWFISILLFFNFGSANWKSYMPLVLVYERYLFPLLFPAVVVAAGFIADLIFVPGAGESRARMLKVFSGFFIAFLILAASSRSIYGYIKQGPNLPAERDLSAALSSVDTIYTDIRTKRAMEFFWKERGQPAAGNIRDFEAMKVADVAGGAYVLVNRRRAEFIKKRYEYTPPAFYEDIPAGWVLKWKKHGAELYETPVKDDYSKSL